MLKILFEDEALLAIHKPSGIPSHTLENSADQSCEAILKVEKPELSLFLVHRLDTGTSGVLLFAKSESAYLEMRALFAQKLLKKVYWAWSEASPEQTAAAARLKFPFRIELPLAHHPKSKKRMMVLPLDKHRHFRGKPIPALSILHSVATDSFAGMPTLRFELEIVTGVMHQIRVHLEHLGFPLIGDPIYQKKGTEPRPLPRLGLHAFQIEFVLREVRYKISAPFLD